MSKYNQRRISILRTTRNTKREPKVPQKNLSAKKVVEYRDTSLHVPQNFETTNNKSLCDTSPSQANIYVDKPMSMAKLVS